MASMRVVTLLLLSALLSAPQVLGQAVGVNPGGANNPAPAPAPGPITINAPTDAPTSEPATTAQTSAQPTTGTSTGTSAPSSTGTTSNTATTSSDTSATTASTQPTTSVTFATTNNPSTSTQPPLPTLSGVLPPPLIVPDTSNAPFMQKSNLPEGTVFICVGGALGFLGLCVLAWRGLVVWSLHRSVKRAAEAAYAPDSKSMFGWGAPPPTSAGYKSMYTDSNMSLEMLSSTKTPYAGAGEVHGGKNKEDFRHDRRPGNQHNRRSTRQPSNSNLFFSPTNTGGNVNAPGNRGSGYMPAGFYPSTQPSAGNSSGPLARGSEGGAYGRLATRDGFATPSPPDSPSLRPHSRPQSGNLRPGSAAGASTAQQRYTTRLSQDALARHDAAQSKRKSRTGPSGDFSLNAPPTGRAPSTYLEDLFENHGHGPGERF